MHYPRVANNWVVKEFGISKTGEKEPEVRGIENNEEAKERDINVKAVTWIDGIKTTEN